LTKQGENSLSIIPLPGFPDIKPKDDIGNLILINARRHNIKIISSDILIITQKIISKTESRLIDLRTIIPGKRAIELHKLTGKDTRLIQLILEESQEVLRARPGLIIVKHKLGFVCANAGIDHSNTVPGDFENNWVLLLPKDPDQSARLIKETLIRETGKQVGVMIIDSHGRAWRNGTVGTAIGIAGVPGLVDLRGRKDLYGYTLKATQVAAADELAAAASLIMGQADESIPCVIARGFPYPLRQSNLRELIRPNEEDLFK
jgi:coenzyme F420-0:L-glutamate ligase/coenzyme F420-1:gamma-L-glutamate ligase